MEVKYPQEINFFTTYSCNSRCLNCFIWKEQELAPTREELDSEEINKLFSDSLFVRCTTLGLAGGEPTISPFFWKLLGRLPEDKRIAITTNALNSKELVDFLSRSQNNKGRVIQVSVDGLEEVNDRVRGIKGAYRKATALLEQLQELDVERLVSFTINRLNYHQVKDCYELANHYGAEFSTRLAYCGGAYSNRQKHRLYEFNHKELEVLDRLLESIVFQELQRPGHYPPKVIFISKIIDYYRGVQQDLPCKALETGMVIDLYGDVFPNCPAIMKPIGNLKQEKLSDIWAGKRADEVRKEIDALKCGGCWNDCQMVNNIALDKDFVDREYEKLKIAFLRGRPVPDIIDFDRNEFSLLLNGWFALEGDAGFRLRWSEQEFSILSPQGTRSLEIFGMLPKPNTHSYTPGTLDVVVDNERTASITLVESQWKNYSITLIRPVEDLTPIRFKLSRYYCPREEGKSNDGRKLGMAVNRISFLRR